MPLPPPDRTNAARASESRRAIATVAVLVPDYDEAIAWFTRALGFVLEEDTALGGQKRWVVVRPPGGRGAAILLARAASERQRAAIGEQAGGRVFLFLETDDFDRDHAAFAAAGVAFREAPRDEPYGRVAQFADPFGNLWDLIEPARPRGG